MRLKGLIFDMDGVVVDNHHYHFRAWMDFAKKYQFQLDEDIYREKFNGKTNKDLFEMIFGKITHEEIKKYSEEKEKAYQEIYKKDMKAHVGLIDFLEFARAQKFKIALGTSAPTGNVDFTLDTLGLRKFFDVIVDGSDVKKGKPDPEVYLLCSYKLGLEPKECIVFEDSLAGLESGIMAGCKVVGVATSHKRWELENKTDTIIHDFNEARRVLNL